MLNKALFKKAIIFLLPIPLIVGEVLYLARESVQNNLNHLLEKTFKSQTKFYSK